MPESLLYVVAGALAVAAAVAAAMALRFWQFCRYQGTEIASLRRDLVSARREVDFEAERARRIVGAAAAPMLTLLADHVERRVGHIEGAFLLERMASGARQRRWHVEERDRIFLVTRGISIERPHPADLVAAALQLAHQLLEVEERNLEVARHCQIVDGREEHWVAEVMSRLQRIFPGESGVKVLEYFVLAFKHNREVERWAPLPIGLPVRAAQSRDAAPDA